jgi:hypothetical protein
MYWIWFNEPTSDEDAAIYDPPPVFEEEDISFGDGDRVERAVPPITVVRDADAQGVLPDNVMVPRAMGMAFSSRLRALLAEVGVDNIDYYPCRITNPADGTATDDYMLANLVGKVACVDFEQSDLEMHRVIPDTIQFINSLVLKEGAIGDALMFRLAEFIPLVVVHEKVKDACVAAGITGVRFYEPENVPL